MKTHFTVALMLLLGLLQARPTQAQMPTPTPSPVPVPTQAQAPQDPESEGFQFPPQEAPSGPEPINPVSKSLDSGKLMIALGSARNFGYHIGEPIPVTIVISADPNVQVNFEALKRKTLTAEASDFEFADNPLILKEQQGAKTVWRIQLLLRSWVVKPVLVLNCDLHYATDFLPDGKTPNWKPVSTPDFVIETSNLASDNSKNLMPGDMEAKEGAKPLLTQAFKLGGYFLIALLPSWLLLQLLRRPRPRKALSRNEIAWAEFDAVTAELQSWGAHFSYEQLTRISRTLRTYLNVESVPTSQCAIALEEFFALQEDKAEKIRLATSALAKLDRALYGKASLSDTEELALAHELEQVVPRAQQA